MKIQEIYTQYNIMPSLQLHMLRVAGVSTLICNSIQERIDSKAIIAACLLHDMGNILKFNLDLFPEFLQPEGKEYWQQIKNEFEGKYGKDEHEATISIAKEIGVGKRVIELIDAFRFSAAKENYESHDLDRMICTYADMRVKPTGVVLLEERLLDGRKRFKINKGHLEENESFFNTMTMYLQNMEKDIFRNISINLEDINNETVNPLIENLRNFEL